MSNLLRGDQEMASRFESWAKSVAWEPKSSSAFFTDCLQQELPSVEGIKKWAEALYPPSMGDYITHVYLSHFITQHLRFIEQALGEGSNLQLLEGGKPSQVDSPLPFGRDRPSLALAAEHLKEDLISIHEHMRELKQMCVSDGFRVYEIEQLFNVDETKKFISRRGQIQPTANLDQNPNDTLYSFATRGLRPVAMDTSSLRNWNSSHDRINGWLLHILQASKEAASLHRSFLPDPSIDDDNWARLVLKYWSLDGAAPKHELSSHNRPASTAVDSQGSRSIISAASAGIFLDPEFQRDIDSG
jgi:hypothetical protein